MTREEAINFLKGYLDEEVYTEKCRNAHKMAIDALEQESCNELPTVAIPSAEPSRDTAESEDKE